MPKYLRTYVPGGTYFFTVALLERQRHLLTGHIENLRTSFRQVKTHRPFNIEAIVIMPDHLHCLWTLPEQDVDYATRWRLNKTAFAKSLAPDESLSARRQKKHERGIWQRRFWEHCIRDQNDFDAHLDYIHYNPVKHGAVKRVADWPYSSFHKFVKAGFYPLEWAAPIAIQEWELAE